MHCSLPGISVRNWNRTHGDDLRALVESKAERVALVAGHEKIRETRNGHRQQIVVVGVLADGNRGKVLHNDRDVAQFIDQPFGERRRQPLPGFSDTGPPA